MRSLALISFSLISAALLTACGGGKDNAIPPSPLMSFQQTVNVRMLWSVNAGDGAGGYYLRLTPAADDGVVYIASRNGSVVAVNASTGATLWEKHLAHKITGGVAVGGGDVYVATDDASLVALSEDKGQIEWTTSLSNEMLAPPAYSQGAVVAHTIDGSIAAYSAATGALNWRYDQSVPSLTLHAAGQPQIVGGKVVVGCANGQLIVLDLATGRIIWEQHVAYPTGDNPVSQMVDITVTPIVVNGVVYAATYQGQIGAYSLDNGQLIWQHDISSYAGIAANSTQILVSDANSQVWAFDTESGAVDWKQSQLMGRNITGPALYHDSAVVADQYGYVHFMALSDGHFVSRASLNSGALAQPIVYNDKLYIATAKGQLIAIMAS